jgi:integrase
MAGSKRFLGDNKWKLCISLGYDNNGSQIRKYKTISARSEKAADKELAKFYVEVTNKPVITGDRIRFGEFIELWRQRYSNKLSNTTINRNEMLLELRILPAFYNKQLCKITEIDILRFIDELRLPGMRKDSNDTKLLSDGSVQMHYKFLHSIFNKAVQWGYISQNPCDRIPRDEIPKANYRTLPIWQQPDFQRFLYLVSQLKDNPYNVKYKLLVSLFSLTGARRGEIFALTWDRIDFTNKCIYINQSTEVIPHQPLATKAPKTDPSVRWVGIDDYTIDLFNKHMAYQQQYLLERQYINPQHFVFLERMHTSSTNESRSAYPSCFRTWLIKFCEQNNLPPITAHSFRHMAGTYALALGAPITSVQRLLGHSNIKTTEIYLHDLEGQRQKTTQVLSNQFNNFRNPE